MNEYTLQLKQMKRAMISYVYLLYEMAYENHGDILEIGVRAAQSTRAFLAGIQDKKDIEDNVQLTSIDISDCTHRVPEELNLGKWRFVLGDSHDDNTLNTVSDREYGILLIDGDHRYEGVKKDFEMYAPLVRDTGIILMHDITNKNEGVKLFWKELQQSKHYNVVGLNYGRAANGVVPGMGLVQKK